MKTEDIIAEGVRITAIYALIVACLVGMIRLGVYCLEAGNTVLGALIILLAILLVFTRAVDQLSK